MQRGKELFGAHRQTKMQRKAFRQGRHCLLANMPFGKGQSAIEGNLKRKEGRIEVEKITEQG